MIITERAEDPSMNGETESNASTLHEIILMPRDAFLSFGDKQFENQLLNAVNRI